MPLRPYPLLVVLLLLCSCKPAPPPTPSDPVGAPPSAETVAALTAALGRIQAEGGAENNLLLVADETRNIYIQFLASQGGKTLSGEAVSNAFLAPEHRLSAEQLARLTALGWVSPPGGGEGNLTQSWEASDDAARRNVAQTVLKSLAEGYGVPSAAPLKIEVILGK